MRYDKSDKKPEPTLDYKHRSHFSKTCVNQSANLPASLVHLSKPVLARDGKPVLARNGKRDYS